MKNDIDEEKDDGHDVEDIQKEHIIDLEEETDDIIDEEELENPKSAIKKLRTELKQTKQEKMDLLTSWQKDKADFLNSRKRDQETQADVIRFANQALIADLLPTLDGYEQAKAQPDWTQVNETWKKGIEALMTKIYASLQKVGVEGYGAAGEPFDPNLHQAIGNEPTADKAKDHTIASVMQRGYTLHNKVVRPAMVKVYQAE